MIFFGFIQIRDTLSTNGEHHRVAEVKSFPAIPKSMRSVNGYQNGANLKKWSVLLVCTIHVVASRFFQVFFVTQTKVVCLSKNEKEKKRERESSQDETGARGEERRREKRQERN